MKKFAYIFSLFILISIFPKLSEAQFNLNKLKDKAKEKLGTKEAEQNKEKDNTNKSETDKKQTIKNQISNVLAELQYDSQPSVSFLSIINQVQIDAKSGVLRFGSIDFINLPQKDKNGNTITYSAQNDGHKLEALLDYKNKKNEKQTLGKLLFLSYSSPNKVTTINPANNSSDGYADQYKINDEGEYVLDFRIDGKSFFTLDFVIIKKDNKQDGARFFIGRPWGQMGMLTFDRSGTIEFYTYHAYQSANKNSAPEKEYISRIMREDNSVIAANFNSGGLYMDARWKNMKSIFVKENNQYLSKSDLIANSGNYYIQVDIDAQSYKYPFVVKDNQIIGSDKFKEENGCWLQSELLNIEKIDGYIEPLAVKGPDKFRLLVKDPKTGNISGKNPGSTIKDGDLVTFSDLYFSDEIKNKFAFRDIIIIGTLKKGNEIIAQHKMKKIMKDLSSVNAILVPQGEIYGKLDEYTPLYIDAMITLPSGKHQLTYYCDVQSGKEKFSLGKTSFYFQSDGKNEKYRKTSIELKDRLTKSQEELNNLFSDKYGKVQPQIYYNNCNRTVWLRHDVRTEYYVYPGQSAILDQGFVEIWDWKTYKFINLQTQWDPPQANGKINICK